MVFLLGRFEKLQLCAIYLSLPQPSPFLFREIFTNALLSLFPFCANSTNIMYKCQRPNPSLSSVRIFYGKQLAFMDHRKINFSLSEIDCTRKVGRRRKNCLDLARPATFRNPLQIIPCALFSDKLKERCAHKCGANASQKRLVPPNQNINKTIL